MQDRQTTATSSPLVQTHVVLIPAHATKTILETALNAIIMQVRSVVCSLINKNFFICLCVLRIACFQRYSDFGNLYSSLLVFLSNKSSAYAFCFYHVTALILCNMPLLCVFRTKSKNFP